MFKFALGAVGIILGWTMVVPAFEFPDEQAHLGSISYLISTGHMPGYKANDLTLEMETTQKLLGTFRDGNGNNEYTYHPDHHVEYSDSLTGLYEGDIRSLNTAESRTTYVGTEAAKYPPLYYAFTSLFTRLVDRADILTRLFVSRLGGLLIVMVMGLVIWQIGELVFTSKIYAKTLVLLVMLQPMMSFVSAGVNSDNLHNLLFFTLIYLGLRLLKSGFSWSLILSSLLVCAADIATKPQGYLTIPFVVATFLIVTIKQHKWQLLIFTVMTFALLVFFTQNIWLGYLDFANPSHASLIEYIHFTLNKLFAQNVVWYWGVFKWLGVVLPPVYWRFANRVVLVAVVGVLLYWYKVIRRSIHNISVKPTIVFYLIFVVFYYTLAIFWADWQHVRHVGYSLGIQARYFFPTIVAQMALILIGITSFGWNTASRRYLRRSLVLFFLWLQLGGIWRLVTIYYPGHTIPELIVQASQYKPFFAKGNWWYLWISLYFGSLIYLVKTTLQSHSHPKLVLHKS